MEEGRPVVVLGVGGGIAAYKAVDLCRRLVDAGVHVAPVLTAAALHFVGKATFDALASEPAQSSLWDEASPIPHTRLGQRADLIVVAPATADLMARAAAGMADDLLATTLVASRAPVLMAAAMHTEMWEHPAVRANVATLRGRGVTVLDPEVGRLAGGDVGAGRMAEPGAIAQAALSLLGAGAHGTARADLSGVEVLVSAGGTREAIDPVRVITNRSSGKQGHAVAEAAAARGAHVTLVTTAALAVPPGIDVVSVESAAEMEEALMSRRGSADVIVMAAAVADFRPKAPAAAKLHKADGIPDLVLEPTPDILSGLRDPARPGQVVVGFAAETGEVVERARAKLERKGLDLIVANDVSAPGTGFDHDTNAVTLIGRAGEPEPVPLASKRAVADAVLDRVAALLPGR